MYYLCIPMCTVCLFRTEFHEYSLFFNYSSAISAAVKDKPQKLIREGSTFLLLMLRLPRLTIVTAHIIGIVGIGAVMPTAIGHNCGRPCVSS